MKPDRICIPHRFKKYLTKVVGTFFPNKQKAPHLPLVASWAERD
jgi:hypothetical protein